MKIDKRGTAAVFLAMVLGCMVSLAVIMNQATVLSASRSAGESAMLLSSRSVLTEYDKNLLGRFGLLAFRGTQDDLEAGMRHYAGPIFKGSPYFTMGEIKVSTASYQLSSPDNFEAAVLEQIPVVMAKEAADAIRSNAADKISPGEAGKCPDRMLKNEGVRGSLPSVSHEPTGGTWRNISKSWEDWTDVFRKGTRNYLVNRYIFHYFSDAGNPPDQNTTFFQYEVEYILEGEFSDRDNRKDFMREVLFLRNIINLGFLMADPKKQEILAAAAQLATPGPEAILTQILLAEVWALAESENDLRLLEHGKIVPYLKTGSYWAVDLDSVLEGMPEGYIDTHGEVGLDYRGYLELFLFFMDRETKLVRMMDLIQLDLQGTCDRTFLMQEHQTGFDYEAKINDISIRGSTRY